MQVSFMTAGCPSRSASSLSKSSETAPLDSTSWGASILVVPRFPTIREALKRISDTSEGLSEMLGSAPGMPMCDRRLVKLTLQASSRNRDRNMGPKLS